MPIELSWRVSLSASCLHAAEAHCRSCPRLDPAIGAAVAEPAARLQREIRAAGLPEKAFWAHLAPLSGEIENNRQLVETAACKTVGPGRCSAGSLSALAGCVADLEAALRRGLPDLLEQVATGSEPLRRQWCSVGENLLFHVAQFTDERLVAPSATVDLVYPAQGGAGAAHLPYNSVRIEAVAHEAAGALPEVLRLAWLLSQLNVDLPLFSEAIHPDRRALVAELAMTPAVLAAAVEAGVECGGPEVLADAVRLWPIDDLDPSVTTATVAAWWDSCREMRPRWSVALAALDRMLREEQSSGYGG
ncbi:MAG: hypothetical protein HUU20_15160 [Pirellulales bacterium]|nr:hypothetical protein [Pirellulales bacterium]